MTAQSGPTDTGGAFHFDFDQIDWSGAGETKSAPAALVVEAKRLGARRKRIVKGEGGFFMNYSSLPAEYHIARHRHGHHELIVVVDGGATVHESDADGGDVVLDVGDSIVILAGHHYAITCGAEGMNFLTVRTSDSETALA